jgi:hypothetical protein
LTLSGSHFLRILNHLLTLHQAIALWIKKLGQDRTVNPRNLAALSNSVFSSLQVSGAVNELGIDENPGARECLLLIDGMGADLIAKYVSEFPIFKGRLLNSLKWDERVDPLIWQSVPTLFERAAQEGITVSHIAAKRYEGSGFTQAALRGAQYLGANQIEDIIANTVEAMKPSSSFSYVYINHLDSAGHDDGVGSEKWLLALLTVSELITGLRNRLPKGTRLWVTADHGMINVGEKIILGQDNNLMANVTLVGGEPRARHIYVRDGAINETVAIWREFLGDKADVFSRDEIISAGHFGPEVSLDSRERMGDLIAIAKGEMILVDPTRIKEESKMIGHHGGLEAIEVAIPLLSHQS